MKTTTIKWIQFTIKNSIDFINNWKTSIYSIYERPSYEKVKIFNEWKEKLDWIVWLTWNKFNFSIYGYIFDNDWIKHNVKITQAYNYLLN